MVQEQWPRTTRNSEAWVHYPLIGKPRRDRTIQGVLKLEQLNKETDSVHLTKGKRSELKLKVLSRNTVRNSSKSDRLQSCPLCDPMGYTVHVILQAEYWKG